MILRRFTQHIKEQNWFAVGLDVIVVIVGIFLGMQVQGWYEYSKDRRDEVEFVNRLQQDLKYIEEASSRVLERRTQKYENLKKAVATLNSTDEEIELTQTECDAIGNSDVLNIVIAELPSIIELQSSGRLGIITDSKLRRTAVIMQQRIVTLKEIILQVGSYSIQVLMKYPELISVTSVYNKEFNEINLGFRCNYKEMRQSVSFMNAVSTNLDIVDAYLRDGINPWQQTLIELNQLLSEFQRDNK